MPAGVNREGYSPDHHARYWLSGLEDYDKVQGSLRPYWRPQRRYYDFGGSTGRVFRHLSCQDRMFDVWSSDFKTASFQWNQQHMPTDNRVFLNGLAPPLPIPDAHLRPHHGVSQWGHAKQSVVVLTRR